MECLNYLFNYNIILLDYNFNKIKREMKKFELALAAVAAMMAPGATAQSWTSWMDDFTQCNLYRIVNVTCP